MKSYKEFPKQYIGSSDVASLVLVGNAGDGVTSEVLHFGGDDSYYGYVCLGIDVKIGDHYKVVAAFNDWLKIYDDENLSGCFFGDLILVYRAGERGCIIQVIYKNDCANNND